MKKSISTVAVILMTAFGAPIQANTVSQSTIVIVHGAWSSAGDFKYIEAELKKSGNEVITVNLPGHGSDNTPVSSFDASRLCRCCQKSNWNKKKHYSCRS